MDLLMDKLTSEKIKKRAYELGAQVCGIGGLELFRNEIPGRDPKMILPNAKSIIGFGFAVPRGLYSVMERNVAYYTYTTLGVKYIDEEVAEIFLLKMGSMIEDYGYDACLQKSVPNLRIQGDKETNPEVADTYELIYARPVEPGKPAPDVIIDFGKAAAACGIGTVGLSGRVLSPKYGPYMRWCFIITDAPLDIDKPLLEPLCDKCGECIAACPGHAISDRGLDTWQCSVYYKGAHRSNPFITGDFLRGNPEREAILNGDKRFDAESARAIYPELDFLPRTQWGYAPCLCGRKCDVVCYRHLKETNKI
jgi:epoxyqueuosine reductase